METWPYNPCYTPMKHHSQIPQEVQELLNADPTTSDFIMFPEPQSVEAVSNAWYEAAVSLRWQAWVSACFLRITSHDFPVSLTEHIFQTHMCPSVPLGLAVRGGKIHSYNA